MIVAGTSRRAGMRTLRMIGSAGARPVSAESGRYVCIGGPQKVLRQVR